MADVWVDLVTLTDITGVVTSITGLGAQSQTLNMNSHLISNVLDPVSAQDAAAGIISESPTLHPQVVIFVLDMLRDTMLRKARKRYGIPG